MPAILGELNRNASMAIDILACCLSLLLCGYLAGCETLEQYEEFGATLTQVQLRALRSWKNPKTRRYEAPKKTTLWRIAAGVDIKLFEETVNTWLSEFK